MKGPPTASLIAAPAEQFSLCRTKEAERERRAEQFPGMLGTVDCLQLVPCSQVIVGNILSVVRSASIGPFSLIVSANGTGESVAGLLRAELCRRLLQQHEEECRCRFVQIQASRDANGPAASRKGIRDCLRSRGRQEPAESLGCHSLP